MEYINLIILLSYITSKVSQKEKKKKPSTCSQLSLVELSGLQLQDNLISAAALSLKVY